MNLMRFAILGVAFIAAAAAVLLARGMLGGGTPATQAAVPPPVATVEVLVASKDIGAGHSLDPGAVQWEAWPKKSVPSAGFITKDTQPDIAKAVTGVVVRSPLVVGQPITDASIVRTGSAGFLAATIKQGMRAVSVPVNVDTGAGGFILPNDRVDVMLSRDISGGSGIKNFASETILRDVRVLAMDQTAQPQKDQQSVVAKTATLELMPEQAELLVRSHQMGVLSLALRALGDSSGEPVAEIATKRPPVVFAGPRVEKDNTVVVFRYGYRRDGDGAPRGAGGSAASAAAAPAAPSGVSADIANPVSVSVAPAPLAAMPVQ
ncbi:MAG TPA: Flp pilus assembly protein CpaB [Micropepsaceae bacterium]|nr:Flp pilus assembly protein CpaB [Micropepsaceae bacterium]